MRCVQDLLSESASAVTASESSEFRREAEILLAAALNKPRSYLFAWPEAAVPDAAATRYRSWLESRRRGVPVAYLLGAREFWSLALQVNETTLIPRPETELLIEQALALELPGNASVVDLGTGSGAIALALATERPHWQITAVEQSEPALAVAKSNGQQLGLGNIDWTSGSWFSNLAGRRFALIVSNPPYIAEDDEYLSQGDLRFEPRAALASGVDGLDDIRIIVAASPEYLEAPGQILLEHGFEQGAAVRGLLSAAGFQNVVSHRDLAGHERVSGGLWAG